MKVSNKIRKIEQETKEAKITIEWLGGKDYPPAVTIKRKDGITLIWNFLYDYTDRTYWAEGQKNGDIFKNMYLGKSRKKAEEVYNRIFVQYTKKEEKIDEVKNKN